MIQNKGCTLNQYCAKIGFAGDTYYSNATWRETPYRYGLSNHNEQLIQNECYIYIMSKLIEALRIAIPVIIINMDVYKEEWMLYKKSKCRISKCNGFFNLEHTSWLSQFWKHKYTSHWLGIPLYWEFLLYFFSNLNWIFIQSKLIKMYLSRCGGFGPQKSHGWIII